MVLYKPALYHVVSSDSSIRRGAKDTTVVTCSSRYDTFSGLLIITTATTELTIVRPNKSRQGGALRLGAFLKDAFAVLMGLFEISPLYRTMCTESQLTSWKAPSLRSCGSCSRRAWNLIVPEVCCKGKMDVGLRRRQKSPTMTGKHSRRACQGG